MTLKLLIRWLRQRAWEMESSVSHRRKKPQSNLGTSPSLFDIKADQASKIRELGIILVEAGFVSLDAQAEVLGLPRSTAWTILRGQHKCSGLSVKIIKRMLSSPNLPAPVRVKIMEYVEARLAGRFGHNDLQRRKFYARVMVDVLREIQMDQRH
jgi:hypothetical protein